MNLKIALEFIDRNQLTPYSLPWGNIVSAKTKIGVKGYHLTALDGIPDPFRSELSISYEGTLCDNWNYFASEVGVQRAHKVPDYRTGTVIIHRQQFQKMSLPTLNHLYLQ